MTATDHHVAAKAAASVADLPHDARYLVGVSGGRDSVVLLHLLKQIGYTRLVVAHFDHRLRGRFSTADARFVTRLATREGLKCEMGAADVRSFATANKLSIETAARELRYRFFAEAARTHRCDALFLAHHADDQVETFLFNLFRGTGLSGLAGMRARSTRGRLRLLRPMLGIWRAEIDEYAQTQRLRFREDASNTDTANLRNRFRLRIIPGLSEDLGRDVRKALWRTAEIASAENEWIDSAVPHFEAEASVLALRKLPLALQRRAIHAWLKRQAVPSIGFDEVEMVRALLAPGAKLAKVNLPGDRHVRRRAGKLFVES